MYSLVSGFLFSLCVWDSSILLYILVVCSVLLLSILLLINIWTDSDLGLLVIKLLLKFYRSPFMNICFSLGQTPRNGLAESYGKYMVDFIKNWLPIYKVVIPISTSISSTSIYIHQHSMLSVFFNLAIS